ncbi:MAG: type IV pilus modification protein PilV [Delftia acidovorans]|jgi:type IV pilus assembly protein PilV|uniref:type IV pilus modification protein PilV n=1 Tax=Delftia acidovorans TaxID=80866 RepID=UPI00281A1FF1|nr:type IV pilus modification protein PilV [Delftia acidovorans]MDR3017575.1 type IV pilus modification protein PilV [Delftia acidovorans]
MQPLKPGPQQTGIALIESLIALLIASLGILGILGLQMRTLADTQTGVRRAQAIRLVEDLSERTKANPHSLSQINQYVSDWDHTPDATAANCSARSCGPADMALYHLAQWKASVAQMLPLGKARIFLAENETSSAAPNRRQLGVMISWRENERSTTDDYKQPIGVGSEKGSSTCLADRTCHLQYITLSARCAPYFADQQVQFFCAGQ